MLRLFDTHCHLDDPRYLDEGGLDGLRGLLSAAAQVGVGYLLVPGVAPEEWARQTELIQELVGSPVQLLSSRGLHPQCIPEFSDESLADALALLRVQGAHVSAVGECGLDGITSRLPGGALERQLDALELQLQLAEQLHKPLLLHCFRAHERLIQHLERRGGLAVPFVLHSYSGSAELVPRYRALGAWFSFAGAITWVGARRPLAALRAVPLDHLLLETDGPDQCPQPTEATSPRDRGSRLNVPQNLLMILKKMADVLDISAENLARITTENALGLFYPSGSLLNGKFNTCS